MAHAQTFLSTVSAEFRSYRDALRRDLDRANVTVKVQEDFIATGTETLDKLDEYIRQCDAVIHLVGDMTGALAQAPSLAVIRQRHPDLAERLPVLDPFLKPDAPALSYTQWEAWLALYHRKVLVVAVPQDGAPRNERYQMDEDQRAAQQTHLALLASVERYPEIRFANADRLAVDMLRSKLQDILAAGAVTKPDAARFDEALELWLSLEFSSVGATNMERDALWRLARGARSLKIAFLDKLLDRDLPNLAVRFSRAPHSIARALVGLDVQMRDHARRVLGSLIPKRDPDAWQLAIGLLCAELEIQEGIKHILMALRNARHEQASALIQTLALMAGVESTSHLLSPAEILEALQAAIRSTENISADAAGEIGGLVDGLPALAKLLTPDLAATAADMCLNTRCPLDSWEQC